MEVAALAGVADATAAVAVDVVEGGALAAGSVDAGPHATANPTASVATVRTTSMLSAACVPGAPY